MTQDSATFCVCLDPDCPNHPFDPASDNDTEQLAPRWMTEDPITRYSPDHDSS